MPNDVQMSMSTPGVVATVFAFDAEGVFFVAGFLTAGFFAAAFFAVGFFATAEALGFEPDLPLGALDLPDLFCDDDFLFCAIG